MIELFNWACHTHPHPPLRGPFTSSPDRTAVFPCATSIRIRDYIHRQYETILNINETKMNDQMTSFGD
ncbi:hypothetical protein DPMN_149445 [Dreissena polymorpha]|uniref:Uncharacterized protein n=1 Tax=Dreissena polymorpha TaxID=45954 RepID=A0A9D4FEE7_DREPO|nr:hypothetical protein DPMN_149445 [Dreissena polymorpha]